MGQADRLRKRVPLEEKNTAALATKRTDKETAVRGAGGDFQAQGYDERAPDYKETRRVRFLFGEYFPEKIAGLANWARTKVKNIESSLEVGYVVCRECAPRAAFLRDILFKYKKNKNE